MEKAKEIKKCRVCGNQKLIEILSLGEQFISNFIESEKEQKIKVPLELVLCDINSGGCGLLQLKHTTPSNLMYRNYWYRSGMNKTMTEALRDITRKAEEIIPLEKNDLVLDIGCNDGTLLRSYKTRGIKLVGFDPAKNLLEYSRKGTTKIINDFFNAKAFQKEFKKEKAKIITSIAMFYDLDEPNKFVEDIKQCLHTEGVWIIQMSYLPLMLEQNAFDNICHEHLEYYSLTSLENLLKKHEMEVIGVELNDVNGGSFRTYIKHKKSKIEALEKDKKKLFELREREKEIGLDNKKIYEEFAERVNKIKEQLVDFIKREKAKGKKIYVYGASTKGNTLLQFFNLDNKLIEAAAERNLDKVGKKTIGTLIPIISEEQARKEKPDYFLVLPWHFLKEFKEREKDYLEHGGKFIVPLPEFRIIGKNK
jgi:2-polyprenyl-3-methyl-5-hydroxy-6-metoxy-1,4-benzoquinol methylase